MLLRANEFQQVLVGRIESIRNSQQWTLWPEETVTMLDILISVPDKEVIQTVNCEFLAVKHNNNCALHQFKK